jgi:hypothetical protein
VGTLTLAQSATAAPSAPVVAATCAAEILGLAGFSIVPALLPQFIEAWSLTNTQAGWLAGITSAGYMLAVVPLVSLTDALVDDRRSVLQATTTGRLSRADRAGCRSRGVEFAPDSPLEGDGFELPVPRELGLQRARSCRSSTTRPCRPWQRRCRACGRRRRCRAIPPAAGIDQHAGQCRSSRR